VNSKQVIGHINKSLELAAKQAEGTPEDQRSGLALNFTFIYASGSGIRVQIPVFRPDDPSQANEFEIPRITYGSESDDATLPLTVIFNDGSSGFGLVAVQGLAACVVNRVEAAEARA